MQWSYRRSIILTKVCLLFFVGGYIFVIVSCPALINRFVHYSVSAVEKSKWIFMVTIYACAVPIGFLLWNLWQLISDIGLEKIFTISNIRRLRIISWMCFMVSLICLISMSYYLFWGIITACLALMGLLIRVIKNTFERARELKEEVDLTI